jgi:hypothetical protein
MDMSFMSSINYVAVFAAAVLFFVIGSLWFSFLFRELWTQELKRHNVVIKQPTSNVIARNMFLTFAANCVAAYGMACLVTLVGVTTAYDGFVLGTIAAMSFAVTAVGSVFIWENRSLRLFLIDVGYPVAGIIASAMVLAVWR